MDIHTNTAVSRRKQELANYTAPNTIAREELDAFWSASLQAYAEKPLDVRRVTVDSPLPHVSVDRLTYAGFDDTPIHAWYMVPEASPSSRDESVPVSARASDPDSDSDEAKLARQRPCVVIFPGYTGDRGYPERYASWLLQGYAVLAADVRGQGGETGNRMPLEHGSVKGWVSGNVLDPANSYYHAVAIDAIRAIDAAAAQPETDATKLGVVGGSQGGGLALITAALNPKVTAVVADIPNLCHMDFGLLHSSSSLTELAEHAKRYPDRLPAILGTLARHDLLNLAERITAPVLMSVGWKDPVCMPETVYAVYNRIQSEKKILDYPFSGHEVSEAQHREAILFLQERFR